MRLKIYLKFLFLSIPLLFTLFASAASTQTSSAYHSKFLRPNGSLWFYQAFLWRSTPDVATNHQVSILKTKDFKNFYTTSGTRIQLPITKFNTEIIDPIGHNQGLLNNLKLGFDERGSPIVTYQKYDSKGKTQVYNAHKEGNRWVIHQVTRWETCWKIEGHGALPITKTKISFRAVNVTPDGTLYQFLRRAKADAKGQPASGTWILDKKTLQPTSKRFRRSAIIKSPPGSRDRFNTSHPNSIPVVIRSRGEENFVPLLGDWNGDGLLDKGYYDRVASRFITFGNIKRIIPFGIKGYPYQPITGDWNKNGKDSIGLYHRLSNKDIFSLKDKLAIDSRPYIVYRQQMDKLKKWTYGEIKTKPISQRYFIKWDAMPPNRDKDRSCHTKDCHEYLSDLMFWEFDNGKWISTFIDKVWGGARVHFDFFTHRNIQIIAYYASNRKLTVAIRKLSGQWVKKELDTRFGGWDSHNGLEIAVDSNDQVHISGNMHVSPLEYFRSDKNLSENTPMEVVNSFKKLAMDNYEERETTYPKFIMDAEANMFFYYRSGGSGAGFHVIKAYDPKKKEWETVTSKFYDGLAITQDNATPVKIRYEGYKK